MDKSIVYSLERKIDWQDGNGIWTPVKYTMTVDSSKDQQWVIDLLKNWMNHSKKSDPPLEPDTEMGVIAVRYRIVISEVVSIVEL